ncbi:lysozyme C-like [Sceloporus undulatus]|uniref:lysozyme C-like n=1 Tax=Sceloporus undulatus TaxID=8520 RepID=UPI001C4DB801|nr:lysozyme C-like [Sceloporus undulatus]
MKMLLFLGVCLLAALAVPSAEGKKMKRCDVARYLKKHVKDKVADWVCLVEHESSYNTKAINNNGNSRDYGLFQINSKYWCDDGKTAGAKNACHIKCNKFLDDNLDDDMTCALKIAHEAKGLTPWVGWKKHCKGKNVSKYIKGCF